MNNTLRSFFIHYLLVIGIVLIVDKKDGTVFSVGYLVYTHSGKLFVKPSPQRGRFSILALPVEGEVDKFYLYDTIVYPTVNVSVDDYS
jgi:hypothetical protein